jgi:hypothetical protein
MSRILYGTDCCYVCEAAFGANLQCELHHVIPEYLGGKDGPLVALCETHHKLVHAVSRDFIKHGTLLVSPAALAKSELHDAAQNRVRRLAAVILDASLKYKSDPNRILSSEFEYTEAQAKMLDELKTILGKKSRQAVLIHLLEQAHKKMCPGKY